MTLRVAGAAAVVLVLGETACQQAQEPAELHSALESPHLEPWDLPMTNGPELVSSNARAALRDRDGTLWFSTDEHWIVRDDVVTIGAVSRFDPRSRTAEHVAEAEQRVATTLRDIFHKNADKPAQIVVYRLLDQDDFFDFDAEQVLAAAFGRAVSRKAVNAALQELRLLGFVVEEQGRLAWAIPLLHDTLRAGNPGRAAAQLAEELLADGG